MPRTPGKSDDPFYAQELPGLDGLNAVNATCKHEENVYQHIEDKGLGPCEKIIYILQKGSDTQRTTTLDNLKVGLEDCTTAEVSRIIAELNDCMWQLEVRVQISGAEALIKSIPFMHADNTTELIDLTETMLQLREERIRDSWCEVYVVLLKHLPQDIVEGRMVEVALKKGDLAEPLYNRALCCRLIGGFCERAPNPDFITQFLDKTIALCQDTDLTVRATMCGQLNAIGRTLGQATTKGVIMTELFELLDDEEGEVARTAFCSLMDLMDFLDPVTRRERAYPVIKGYVQNTPPAIEAVLTESFGQYIWAVKQDIAAGGDEDIQAFLRYFQRSAADPSPYVRRQCAYNLPSMCASLPLGVYQSQLHPITKALSEDSFCDTRVSIAAGLHELTKLLGAKSYSLFKNIFTTLLQDKEVVVQDKLIENISVVLNNFLNQIGSPEERDQYFSVVLPAVVRWWEPALTSLQRLEALYRHLRFFPDYFTAAQLHGTLIPLLLRQLSTGPRCLVPQCAGIILLFSRKLSNSTLESDIFCKLVVDFGKSRSYWNRLAFLEVCRHTLDFYSRKFFRERLFDNALELHKDPVSSVRRRLCLMLPLMKRSLKPPAEVDHMANLIQVVSKLQLDPNAEVLEAIRKASSEIDAIDKDIRLQNDQDRDKVDTELEMEEQVLKEVAMEQDKQERRQKIREMLQNDRLEKNAQAERKGGGGGGGGGPKRASGEGSRLPPAPTGPVVRQPLGGSGSGPSLFGTNKLRGASPMTKPSPSEKKRTNTARGTSAAKR